MGLVWVLMMMMMIASAAAWSPRSGGHPAALKINAWIGKVSAFGAIVATLMGPSLAQAMVPTMDDYNSGTGTVVRVVASKKDKLTAAAEVSFPGYTQGTLANFVDYMENAMKTLTKLVEQKKWADVLLVCKTLDKNLPVKYLGLSGLSDFADTLQLSTKQAREVDGIREELSFVIGQLRDSALSLRVTSFVFNRDDLAQVKLLATESLDTEDDTGKVNSQTKLDEDEPKALLKEAKELVAKLKAL